MNTFGPGKWTVSHAGNEFMLNEGLPTKVFRRMTENRARISQYGPATVWSMREVKSLREVA